MPSVLRLDVGQLRDRDVHVAIVVGRCNWYWLGRCGHQQLGLAEPAGVPQVLKVHRTRDKCGGLVHL